MNTQMISGNHAAAMAAVLAGNANRPGRGFLQRSIPDHAFHGVHGIPVPARISEGSRGAGRK